MSITNLIAIRVLAIKKISLFYQLQNSTRYSLFQINTIRRNRLQVEETYIPESKLYVS